MVSVHGTVQGMALGLGGGGVSGLDIGKILNISGTPIDAISGVPTSGIAWDGESGQHYMFLTGSAWVKLGSVA